MRRHWLVLLSLLLSWPLMLVAAPLAASPLYPNEPVGFTQITEFGFDTLSGGSPSSMVANGGAQYNMSIVTDAQAPKSCCNVLRDFFDFSEMGTGILCCGGDHQLNNPAAFGEFYASAWMKLSNPFAQYSSGIEKGFKFEYAQTVTADPNDGAVWFAWINYADRVTGGQDGTMEAYVSLMMNRQSMLLDNCHLWVSSISSGDCPGGFNLRGNLTPTVYTKGNWHRIEVYWKNSTTGTSQDGIVRMWIDGVQTHEFGPATGNGINTYQDVFRLIEIGQAWQNGSGTEDKAVFVDHFYVSANTSGAPPPPQPPAAPMQLRVQ